MMIERLAGIWGLILLTSVLRELNTMRRESIIYIEWFSIWRLSIPYPVDLKHWHIASPILGDGPCTVGTKWLSIKESPRLWERPRPFCLPVGKNARSAEIQRVDAFVAHLKAQGVPWLAAPHVGVPVRILLHNDRVLLNPRIVLREGGTSECTVYFKDSERIRYWLNITVEQDRMAGSTEQHVYTREDACVMTWLIMQL